jgi:hypothetical protein
VRRACAARQHGGIQAPPHAACQRPPSPPGQGPPTHPSAAAASLPVTHLSVTQRALPALIYPAAAAAAAAAGQTEKLDKDEKARISNLVSTAHK